MHVLQFLSDPKNLQKPEDSIVAEYRLLCSGTIYRDILGDWSKSDTARILLDDPLLLFAASRPVDDYPLELVLHVTVPRVTETDGFHSTSYYPDDEVANDLAALLSLHCRRLITVAGKANQKHTASFPTYIFHGVPTPLPVVTSMRRSHWPSHPYTFITGWNTLEVKNYNPLPKPVDPRKLAPLLLGLPGLEHAQSLVASARLYALALELIHERPDISYQLLISSVETIADAALSSFQPPVDAKVEHQKAVFDLAISFGIQQEQATRLAIEACKLEYWVKRKFKKFLIDNAGDSIWSEQDDLYPHGIDMFVPQRDAFERILGKVYNARSKATHTGQPFPVTASHTGGPTIPMRIASALFRSQSSESTTVFPPVIWFERVVNDAICHFWERSITNTQQATQVRGTTPTQPES